MGGFFVRQGAGDSLFAWAPCPQSGEVGASQFDSPAAHLEALGDYGIPGSPARVIPCPCGGYVVFDEPPGSYDICPICFWEDDALSSSLPTPSPGGANRVTLVAAQAGFASLATSVNSQPNTLIDPASGEDQ